MVGPRSTGCRRCVQRKVRCDEERPTCGRCRLARLSCPGYNKPLTWVNASPDASVASSSRVSPVPRAGSMPLHRAKTDLPLMQQVLPFSILSIRMPGLEPISGVPSSPSPYTEDTFCAFYLDRTFSFGSWNEELQQARTWFWRAIQTPSSFPVSHAACRAVMFAFFANVNNSEEQRQQAYSWHRKALRQMRASLMGDWALDTLFAAMLLSIYEGAVCTTPIAWRNHLKAFGALCQRKGAAYFQHDQEARSLLMLSRHHTINDGLLSKVPCFLEDDEWTGLLRSQDREAGPLLALGDYSVHLPRISREVQELDKDFDEGKAKRTLKRLLQHLANVRAWWDIWCEEPARRSRQVPVDESSGQFKPPPLDVPDSNIRQRTVMTFTSLDAAGGYCLYHTHILLVMRMVNNLLVHLPADEVADAIMEVSDFVTLTIQGGKARIPEEEIIPHAVAICEALHYYTLPIYISVGATYMGLPARVAYLALDPAHSHALWLEDLTHHMAARSGFLIPKYMLAGWQEMRDPLVAC